MPNMHLSHAFVERRPSTDLTPEYEDFGLFKSDVLAMEVQVSPTIYRTSRHDLVVRGYAANTQRFEVVFAGRRSAMAGPLVSHLDTLKSTLIKQTKGKSSAPLDLDSLRVALMIEGTWRRRHWTDESGWQRHINQLVAARWSLKNSEGRTLTFGVSPSHLARPALPVMSDGGAREGGHIQQAARSN